MIHVEQSSPQKYTISTITREKSIFKIYRIYNYKSEGYYQHYRLKDRLSDLIPSFIGSNGLETRPHRWKAHAQRESISNNSQTHQQQTSTTSFTTTALFPTFFTSLLSFFQITDASTVWVNKMWCRLHVYCNTLFFIPIIPGKILIHNSFIFDKPCLTTIPHLSAQALYPLLETAPSIAWD